jgi:Alginate export
VASGVSVARVTRIATAAGLIAGVWAARAWAQVPAPAPETIAVGDWQLAPVAEARVRGEYAHDLDDQDHGLLLERARLGLGLERGPVEARVVLQDVRTWDVAQGTTPVFRPTPFVGTQAYEAWGEAHTASPRATFLRVGRQPVSWGEGRLLGINDWSPQGRSLDAVRGRLPVGDGAFELLAASLSDPSDAPLSAYGELLGARGQWAMHPLFAIEAYALVRLAHGNPPISLGGSVRGQTYTGALRLYGDSYAWTWGVEGAYQLGRATNVNSGEDRSAWAAAGHVAHTFERIMLLPTVRLGVSYASGDDGGSTYRQFDPLLPDVHVWHGAMDLFAWSNEEEASARVAIAPWTDAAAAVEYRYARLAQPAGPWITGYLLTVGETTSTSSRELGHEIDGSLRWSPWASIELLAGYSVLVLGNQARAILTASLPGAAPNASQFAYLQAALRLP